MIKSMDKIHDKIPMVTYMFTIVFTLHYYSNIGYIPMVIYGYIPLYIFTPYCY